MKICKIACNVVLAVGTVLVGIAFVGAAALILGVIK